LYNSLFIVGPTASGKTDFAISLSKLLNSEIISADSRQVYKYMPVASSVPSEEERKRIKHHFIEIFEPEKDFNAGEFGNLAREKIKDILSRKLLPLLVGGSGLYIRAVIDGFFEEVISDKSIREKLYSDLHQFGKSYLFRKLEEVDPESAGNMDETKFRRVIRALEVYYSSGKKISELQTVRSYTGIEALQIGLLLDRDILYQRINERVDIMISNGLLDEVRKLMESGYSYKTHNSLNTVGIKEVFKYFENVISYDEMVELIKKNTRNYAKRQMTWFRKDKRIFWIDIPKYPEWNSISEKLIKEFGDFLTPYLKKN
jgi:tRNA dimethylallyltransferase